MIDIKKEVPIVLLGEKDHGKSTLIGRLLLDTNSIKEKKVREIQEVDKSLGVKFELAHLVDSFKEERLEEMTYDTTKVILKGEERNYELIDVPGHKELISNMLTGAAGAEAALLLIAVDEGLKKQTKEHLEIAKLLGVEQLGVVVNKMDKVNFQERSFVEVVKSMKVVLNQIGYNPEQVKFFPVSALNGDNVCQKSEKMSWYTGVTLMEFLEKEFKEPISFLDFPLIFLIQDKWDFGKEKILVGPIIAGKMRVEDEVKLLPLNQRVKIKKILDSEKEINEAREGQNIGVILSNDINVKRGDVITVENSNLKIDTQLSGEGFWLKKPSQRNVVLECGLARIEGELVEPKIINALEKSSYTIKLQNPIVFEPSGKTILGKMVLKEEGKIIAAGNIK